MDIKNELDKDKVALIAIGSGTPEQARDFSEQFEFAGELYVDPELRSYKAFGLVRGFWKTLGPSSIAKGIGTMFHGHFQGLSAGDLWQQGGLFVLGPGNRLLFAHRNPKAGFQADLDQVLAVCRMPESPNRAASEEGAHP